MTDDHEDLKDKCMNDPFWAADEIERLQKVNEYVELERRLRATVNDTVEVIGVLEGRIAAIEADTGCRDRIDRLVERVDHLDAIEAGVDE